MARHSGKCGGGSCPAISKVDMGSSADAHPCYPGDGSHPGVRDEPCPGPPHPPAHTQGTPMQPPTPTRPPQFMPPCPTCRILEKSCSSFCVLVSCSMAAPGWSCKLVSCCFMSLARLCMVPLASRRRCRWDGGGAGEVRRGQEDA